MITLPAWQFYLLLVVAFLAGGSTGGMLVFYLVRSLIRDTIRKIDRFLHYANKKR